MEYFGNHPLILQLYNLIQYNDIDEVGYIIGCEPNPNYPFYLTEDNKKLGILKGDLSKIALPLKESFLNDTIEILLKRYDLEQLNVLSKVLLICYPALYSGYRIRKQILNLKQEWIIEEIKFLNLLFSLYFITAKVSYTWYHRKWIIQQLKHHSEFNNIIKQEYQFVYLLLKKVNRNYYIFLYYNFLIQSKHNTIEDIKQQLEFSIDFIQNNPNEIGIYHSCLILFEQLYKHDKPTFNIYKSRYLDKLHQHLLFYKGNQAILQAYYLLVNMFYKQYSINIKEEIKWLDENENDINWKNKIKSILN